MSKRKPVFIIEIRRREKSGNRSIGWTFGAFSSAERATKYIKENNEWIVKECLVGYKKDRLFFAILKLEVDGRIWDGPIAEIALDLEGKQTYWF